jgi:hypothetical protein
LDWHSENAACELDKRPTLQHGKTQDDGGISKHKTSAWRVVCFLNFSLATGVALADAPLRLGGQIEMKLSGVPSAEISAVSSVYTVDGDGSVNLPHIGRLG